MVISLLSLNEDSQKAIKDAAKSGFGLQAQHLYCSQEPKPSSAQSNLISSKKSTMRFTALQAFAIISALAAVQALTIPFTVAGEEDTVVVCVSLLVFYTHRH
jgi:hypothetical protein